MVAKAQARSVFFRVSGGLVLSLRPRVVPRAGYSGEFGDRWMTRPQDGGCEVVGCDDPATGSYLHAAHGAAVEFLVCAGHVARLQAGVRPVVLADRRDDGRRPTLVLE
jgi:hypothetical protein